MAKKDGSNPFAAAASKRQAEQDALKQGLVQDAAGAAQEDSSADEARVKLTLALSAGDKFKLKMAAAKRGVTVAKLVHEWIATLD